MAKPQGHKRGCKCVICSRGRKKTAARKRTAAKRKATPARKKNGTLNQWIKATAVRVREVGGRLLVDLKK